MARTKGALNKRTRLALSEAESGDFANGAEKTLRFLIDTATDTRRDDAVRMQAANVVLPYLRPKLSAVGNTIKEPPRSQDDILEELRLAFGKDHALFDSILPAGYVVTALDGSGN
jgi:hypothetical protein